MKDKIREIVINSIIDLNERLEDGAKIEMTEDPVLFSKEKRIDSLSFVNLIVAVEEAIQDEFDISISIVSEKAFSRTKSPFRKVSTMVDYIEELIAEEG